MYITSLDFLYYSLGLGFLVLVVFLCYALSVFAQTLATLRRILQETEGIAQDVARLKNNLTLGLFGLLGTFVKQWGSKSRRKA